MNKTKHFKRTAFNLSAKSMVSTLLLLIAMLMPQGAWATDFISEVKYGVNGNQNTAKGYLSGYTIIDHDFNNGTSGDWVYIGYKTSTNAGDAITGLLVVTNDTESGSTTYGDSGFKKGGSKTMMVDGKRYYLAEWGGNADMNHGNKTHKNPVYLYYTKDGNTTNGAQLITTLGAHRGELTTNPAGLSVVPLFGGNGSNTNGTYSLSKLSDFGDTNKGGGGSFNYITYTTHTHSFNQYGICSCGFNHVPSGNGTSASPYEVEYYTDLVYLGNLTRNGNETFHAIQTKDIDCGGQDIVPLGGFHNYNYYYFKGTYDGGGHVIKNAKYVNTTEGYNMCIGVFGRINSPAIVKNLGVVNSTFGGSSRIGAVCGWASSGSTIDNCFALNNTFTTNETYGGICGLPDMTITNCYSDNLLRYGGKACSNCYSVKRTNNEKTVTQISADDITSGRLCYLINKNKTDGTQVWYQQLGTGAEAYPTPKKDVSKTVYEIANLKCDGKNANGSYTYTNNKNITPNVDDHNYSSSFTTDKQATCVQAGSKSKHCSVCDAKTEVTTIPALGHGSTGYTDSYSWTGNAYNDASQDTKACTFTLTCKKCSTKVVNGASLTCTKTAHVAALCTATGSTTYQATGSYTAANSAYNYSATKTNVYTVAALGHGSTGYTDSYSWTGNAYNDASQDTKACTFTLTCKKCSTKVVNGASLTCTKTAHVDALCTATGSTTYQATGSYTAANSAYNYSATKTNVYTVAALGHGSTGYTPTYTWGETYDAATCSFTLKCNLCKSNVVSDQGLTTSKVDANHVDATCGKDGNERWTATGSYSKTDDAQYNGTAQTKDYAIPATGLHTFDDVTDPHHTLCTVCDHSFFRYTSSTKKAVDPYDANELKGANGAKLDFTNTYVDGQGVIEFKGTLKTIGYDAFYECSGFTGNLTIPNSVTSIEDYAFQECSGFTGLTIPNSVTSIGKLAFYKCSDFTGNLTIPNSVTSIGNKAFYGCFGFNGNLSIPNSVTSIGVSAFEGCSGFTGNLTIPNSVTSIGNYAFQRCSGFNGNLIIPNSVTSIGKNAFYGCSGFTGIEMNSVPQTGTDAFNSVNCTKAVVLSDDSYVYTGENPYFPEVSSVTYNRYIINDGGMWSFIVPFDIPADQAAGLGKFYQYSKHEESKVYFDDITKIDNADGIVKANTAYFFKPAKDITSITVENPTFDTTGTMAEATNPSEPGLYGTYSQIDIPVGAYGYAMHDGQSTFVKAGTGNLLRSFRAYLWLGSGAYMARAHAIKGQQKGDVNGDGKISLADLTLLVEILNGDATDTTGAADLDGKNGVTIDDLEILRNYLLGLLNIEDLYPEDDDQTPGDPTPTGFSINYDDEDIVPTVTNSIWDR